MIPVLIVLACLAVAWISAVVALQIWCRWNPRTDALHFAATGDGWEPALHEIRPVPDAPAGPRPVILCHGILMSRHCWLPREGVPSVADSLRRRGYSLWVLELRGSGASRTSRADRWDYGFRDYADFDLMAAVEEVKRRTGAPRVDWVAHSLGGMVAYAYLSRHGAGSLHKVVTLGSPVRLGGHIMGLPRLPFVDAALRTMRSVDLSILTRAVAPLLIPAWLPWVELFMNARRVPRRSSLGAFCWGVQRTATRMIRDLHEWYRAGEPFLPRVARTEAPYAHPPGGILALHGRRDRLATPANVGTLTQWFPRALVEAADQPGGRGFGHLDLLAGPPEVERVAERIDRFLRET
ncbi:MAG: alpha/beta fold hydrolase [Planctomycetes bacterium]|nr:alpha/beta fold hydrolase [Planctomycetota bacterium]